MREKFSSMKRVFSSTQRRQKAKFTSHLKCLVGGLIIFTAILMSFNAQAQEEEGVKGFDKSKLFFGGNFGLNFSSYYTLVNVSPQIGYRFNDHLAAGTGVNFIYTSEKSPYQNDLYRYNYTVAGLNVFGRVYPIPQIVLQLQPEYNYTWGKVKYFNPSSSDKVPGKFVPSLLAGAGGAIPAGRVGALLIMAQYDLLHSDRSPYGSRVFFSFGYNVGIF
jgi:hypothetical protein